MSDDLPNSTRARTGRVFIGRKSLKQSLQALGSPDSSRVLVVNGPPGSGKTYTLEFIFDMLANTPSHRVVYSQLDASNLTPVDLVEDIAAQMGRSPDSIPRESEESAARWNQRLANWVVAEIAKDGDIVWWFVFDGFQNVPLIPPTRDLILDLSSKAATHVPQLRIVLLGYTQPLPLQVADHVLTEDLQPIGRPELQDFFEEALASSSSAYTPEQIAEIVDQILLNVDGELVGAPDRDARRLGHLNKAVHSVLQVLLPEKA